MERTNRGFKATRSLLTFNFLILGKRDRDWPFFLPIAGLKLRPLGCLVPGEGKEDGLAGWLGQNIRRHLQKNGRKTQGIPITKISSKKYGILWYPNGSFKVTVSLDLRILVFNFLFFNPAPLINTLKQLGIDFQFRRDI